MGFGVVDNESRVPVRGNKSTVGLLSEIVVGRTLEAANLSSRFETSRTRRRDEFERASYGGKRRNI